MAGKMNMSLEIGLMQLKKNNNVCRGKEYVSVIPLTSIESYPFN